MTKIKDTTVSASAGSIIAANPLAESTFWSTQQTPQYSPVSAATPMQSTTLDKPTGQTFISDINLYAYMRGVDIDFISYNMRPNRKIQVFFDGKDVTKLIQQTNIVKLDNNSEFVSLLPRINKNAANVTANGTITGSIDTEREVIRIGGGLARVFYTKKATDGNTILYLSEIRQPNTKINWSNETIRVQSTRSNAIANVISIEPRSGYLQKSSKFTNYDNVAPLVTANSGNGYYILDVPFLRSTGNIVNKTITVVNGKNPGETAKILSHNVANGEIYISKDFSNFVSSANIVYSIGNVDPSANPDFTVGGVFFDPGKPDVIQTTGRSTGQLYTDEKGIFAGTLRIPDPKLIPEYRFQVGQKLLRVVDSSVNDPEDATTIAEFNFVAFGLDLTGTQINIKDPITVLNVANINFANNVGLATQSPIIAAPIDPVQTPISVETYNPLAQSFFVSSKESPRGIHVPYVDLFFANKGTLPIELQIRPMKNGFPDGGSILPNAVAYLDADDVNVTSNPDANDPNSYTRFTFTSPVYLLPDQEYALVLKTNDFDYDAYVSELGQTVINSNRIVSQQPYSGSLFKSQNSSTYTQIQDEDLMFVIHKCQFNTDGGTVFFSERKDSTYRSPISIGNFSSNSAIDAFEVHSDSIELLGTNINYSYRATSNSTRQFDAAYTNFKADKLALVNERKVIYGPDIPETSFEMRMDLLTSSPDVSPIVYKNKQSISTIQTQINNMSLNSSRIIVANTGNGYTTQNTSVSFTSNTGAGANAVIITEVEPTLSGKIFTLAFDGNGSGYYDDVTVNITTTDANVTPAVLQVLSETGKAGGPALSRYISKTVTLAPEFEAGDLRVYLTAVRPRQGDIQVYYKVRNNFDNETIEDKKWVRMIKVPGTFEYSKELEPIEIEYRPSMNSNTIIYSTNTATFDTFNQFKVKIVLASSDTLFQNIPYVYDMRAIALPGDV